MSRSLQAAARPRHQGLQGDEQMMSGEPKSPTYLPLLSSSLLCRCAMRQLQPLPSTYSVVSVRVCRRAGVGKIDRYSNLSLNTGFSASFGNAWKHDGETIRGFGQHPTEML